MAGLIDIDLEKLKPCRILQSGAGTEKQWGMVPRLLARVRLPQHGLHVSMIMQCRPDRGKLAGSR